MEFLMSIVVWIMFGIIAAVIANNVFVKTTGGVVGDFGVGITGAVGAGALCEVLKVTGATEVSLYSALIISLGAFVPLIAYHALFRDTGKPGHKRV
jgi:uncharacterized membrane protein YeaQ/YmgE (transglycosylase-associated protein family)